MMHKVTAVFCFSGASPVRSASRYYVVVKYRFSIAVPSVGYQPWLMEYYGEVGGRWAVGKVDGLACM